MVLQNILYPLWYNTDKIYFGNYIQAYTNKDNKKERDDKISLLFLLKFILKLHRKYSAQIPR